MLRYYQKTMEKTKKQLEFSLVGFTAAIEESVMIIERRTSSHDEICAALDRMEQAIDAVQEIRHAYESARESYIRERENTLPTDQMQAEIADEVRKASISNLLCDTEEVAK